MVKTVLTYKKPCPLIRVPVLVKKCNPRTCKQLVLTAKAVPVPASCSCKVVRVRRYRKCCCRRKGHRYTVCLGTCWLTRSVQYKFSSATRRCVRKASTSRGCLRCRPPVTARGPCNRRSCVRFVTRTRFGFARAAYLGRCRCWPRSARRLERCCCPPASPWLRSCARGCVVWRRTRFALRAGKCRRSTEVRRRKVRCRRGRVARRLGKCRRPACTRCVTDILEGRAGCRCVRTLRRRFVRCCCPPSSSRRVCVRNDLVMRVSRAFKLVRGRCFERRRKRVIRKVAGCPSVKKLLACNPKTKLRRGIIQTFRVKSCVCVRARAVRISVPCGCPAPVVRLQPCRRSSCVRARVVISFRLRGRRCRRSRKARLEPCCCKKPLLRRRVRCNPRTGQKERVTLSKVFLRTAKRCVTLRAVTSLGIGTNCLSGEARVRRGACNTRTRVAIDSVIYFRLQRRSCRCVQRVKKRRRTCACPPCKRQHACRRGVLVSRTLCFRLLAGSCHALVRTRRAVPPCQRNFRLVRRCRSCQATLTARFNVRVGCRCLRRRSTRRALCCCPPPRRRVSCVSPFLQTVVTGFLLNRRRTKCLQVVVRRSLRVKACRRFRHRALKCDRRSCKRTIYKLVFGLRKCRCRLLRRLRRLVTCCCPRPKRRRTCNQATGVLTTLHVRYRLQHGACARQERIVQKETRCDAVSVRVGPCQRGSRSIVIRGERRVHCSCRPYLRGIHEKCQCPASRVIKAPCHRHNKSRHVLLVYFRQFNTRGVQRCKRFFKKLYTEQCKCPPSVKRRRCVHGRWIKDRITYRLVRRHGQLVCDCTRCRTRAAVTCRAARVVRFDCRGYRQKVRREEWRAVKCRCRPFLSTRIEACNCHLKNTVKTKCLGSVLVHTWTSYKVVPGFKRCVANTRATVKHVACPPKRTLPLSTGCAIRRGTAAYREFEEVWYTKVGCRCRRHARRFVALCRCRRTFLTRSCQGAAVREARYSFRRRGARCVRTVAVRLTPVACHGPRVAVRRGRCGRACVRLVAVSVSRVRACRCRTTTRRVRQRCCVAPRPQVRRTCDARRGYRVTERRRFFLREAGALLRWAGQVVARKVVDNELKVTRERVVCPAPARRVACNRASGVQTTKWVLWARRGCRCERRVRRSRGRCQCRPPRRREGPCRKGLRTVRVVFRLLRGGRCRAKAVVRRERCACPKDRIKRFCDRRRGHRVTCSTRNRFSRARRACLRTITCRSRAAPCRPKRVVRGACSRRTGLRTVRVWVSRLRKERCRCEKKLYRRAERCSCSHLNRRRKKCVRNRFSASVTYHFVLSNGHCALQLQRSLRETVCPKKKVSLSRCVARGKYRGFRVKRTLRFVVKNCACVRRTSRSFDRCSCNFLRRCRSSLRRRCVRNVRVIQRSFCALRLGTCRKRIRMSLRELRCPRKVRARSKPCKKHRDGATYKLVLLYKMRLKNCRCVWTLARAVKRVCKCPPSRFKHHCLHNRVRIFTTVRFFRNVSGSYCRAFSRTRAAAVRCPRGHSHATCDRKTCRRRVVVERYFPVKCHCRRRRAVLWRVCCCPRPGPKRPFCAADGRTLVLRWTRFSLALGRCMPLPCVETRRVRCERRSPVVRMGPCRSGRRHRAVTSFHTRRCRCLARKRVASVRCGCPRKVLALRGKCRGRFAIDRTVSYRLRAKRCVRVELRRRRRCRCPLPHRRTSCSRHNVLTTRFVSFRLAGGSCVRRVLRRVRLLDGCDRRPAVLRVQRGSCRRRRRAVRVTVTVARHCRCRRLVRRKTEGCNCYRPARQLRRCLRKGLLATDTLHFLKRRGRCVVVRRRRRRTIDCFGRRTRFEACRGRRQRTVRVWGLVARRCRCVWRVLRAHKALCRCPRPRRVRSCVRHRWRRLTRISFALRRGRCLRRVATELREIACHVGRFRTASACSVRGFRLVTHVTRRRHHCRCLERRRRRRCRCRCPAQRHAALCLKKAGVRKTVTVTFRLRRCGCERLQRVRAVRVRCGPPLRHVGPCRRAPDGHAYRQERVTIRRRAGCECRRTFKKRRVLCACAPRPLRVTRCRGDNRLVLEETRLVRKGNRCERVRASVKIRRIVCGRSQKTVVCRGKVKTITIRHHFVHQCRCRETVKVIKGRCKCPAGRNLVRRGACVRCLRVLTFSRQRLVGLRCVAHLLRRRQRCCCPKKVRRSRSCDGAAGVVTFVTRTLRFIRGVCVWQKSVRRRRLRCSRRKKRHVRRRRDGFEVVTIITSRRVGCTCRPLRRRFLRRWACPHGRFRFSCTAHNKWLRRSVRFRLVKRRCVKLVRVKLIPVLCKFNRKWITKCRPVPFGSASRVVRLVFLKRKCRCLARRSVRTVLCHCRSSRFLKRCLTKSNTRVYVLEKFLPRPDRKACRRVRLVRRRRIRCQNVWRLVSKSACVKVFAKSVAVDCHCRLKFRKVRRRVRCRRPVTVRGGCHRKSCLRHVRVITFVKHLCRCVRRDRVRLEPCCKAKCPPPRTSKSRCHNGVVKVQTVWFKWIRGKCKRFEKNSTVKFVPKCHYRKDLPVGPCQHGLRLFKIITRVPSKCHCVERHLTVQRRCGHHGVYKPRK